MNGVAQRLLGIFAVLGLSVSATTLYSTGFEPSTYTTGSLVGQNGWIGSNISVQSAVVRTGSQAVRLTSSPSSNAIAYSPFTYDVGTNPENIIRIGIDANLAVSSAPDFWTVLSVVLVGSRIDINIDHDGSVSVYDGVSGHITNSTLPQATWAHFDLILNFVNRTFAVYMNGNPIYTGGTIGGSGGSMSYIGSFYSQGDGNQSAYFDNLSVDSAVQGFSFLLNKVGNGSFIQGQTGTYTLSVRNVGTAPTTPGLAVQVSDSAPTGMTVTGMSGMGWTCSTTPAASCTRSDSLAANGAYPAINVTVNVAPNAPATLTNVATIIGGGATGSGSASVITPIAPGSNLSMTKSHPGNFVRGQQGTYTITVRNTGPGATLSGSTVQVSDTPPTGMTIVAMVGTGWSCPTGTSNTCTRSDSLPAGQNYPSITVTVNVASTAPLSLTNTATLSGSAITGTITASDDTIITRSPIVPGIDSFTASPTSIALGGSSTLSWSVEFADTVTISTIGPVALSGSKEVNPTATTTYTLTATNSVGSVAATATVTVSTTPTLSITKSHNGNFTQGQQGTYTVAVQNTGTVPTVATPAVQVTDTPPTGMTIVSMAGSGWTCSLSPTAACTRSDSLPAGQSYPAITVNVSVAANAPLSLTNTATVTGGGTSGLASTTDATSIVPPTPTLSLTKSHSGNFVQGRQGTYTITVQNTGPVATPSGSPIQISDNPPAGMTISSMTGAGWTRITATPNTCTRSDSLAPGDSWRLTVVVDVALTAPSSLTNTAALTTASLITLATASDPTTILPSTAPIISSFTADTTKVTPGGSSNLSWAVTAADAVTISTVGAVALSGTTQVSPTETTTYVLTATNSTGSVTATVTVTLLTPSGAPNLSITKSHNGAFTQGQAGSYTIVVGNTGTGSTATGSTVQVLDTPPGGMTVTAMTGQGWACQTGSSNICTRQDSLQPQANYPPVRVTVNVAPNAPATLANIATLSGGGISGTLTATDPTIINSVALSISKSHTGTLTRGQQGTYSILVQNSGSAPTIAGQLVQVYDNPPGGVTITSMTGQGWVCTSGIQTGCNRIDSLAAGQSYPAITVSVAVAGNAPDSLTNTATVTGGGMSTTISATDLANVVSPGTPSFLLTKSHTGSFTQGQQGTYTLTVRNTGAVAAPAGTSIQVTDTPPAGMSVLSMSGPGWSCTANPNACTRSDALAAGQSHAPITVTVSVASNAPASLVNAATMATGNSGVTTTASDPTTIMPANSPTLSITKSHSGTFTQGGTGTYTISVKNTGSTPTANTSPVQVTEQVPAGMTITSMSGQGWTCTAGSQNACSRADALAVGASYPDLTVVAGIAPNSAFRLTNVATVGGGGTTNTVSASDPAMIVPAGPSTLSSTSGSGQSTGINTAFTTPLAVTLTNAGAAVAGITVTFAAPLTGPSGSWSNSRTVTVTTDSSGRAVAPAFTANEIGGTYSVTASAAGTSTLFALTNTAGDPPATTLLMPNSVGFRITPSGPATVTQSVTVSTTATASVPVTYRVVFPSAANTNWLSVVPVSLTTPAVLRMTADSSGLAPGRYLALVIVSAAQGQLSGTPQPLGPGVSNASLRLPRDVSGTGQPVPGTQKVIAAVLNVPGTSPLAIDDPRCVWMSADVDPPAAGSTQEETDLACQYFKVSSLQSITMQASANATTNFSASLSSSVPETDWVTARLNANPFAAGTSLPGQTVSTITVDVQKDQIKYDKQLAFVEVTNSRSSAIGSNVALISVAVGPSLDVVPNRLDLDASSGAAPTLNGPTNRTAIADQTITVRSSQAALPFRVTSDVPWLSFKPSSGTASPGKPVDVTVSVNPSASGSSTQGGSIRVQLADGSGKPAVVSVVTSGPLTGAPAISSVTDGASFQPPDIAPGAWVTIKGTGLSDSAAARTWRDDEVAGGKLPTSLDGVSVTINGVSAYVQYISPTQINVLAPGDTTQGEVSVIVKNNGKVSNPVSTVLQPVAPALFQYQKYAIAQRSPDLSLIGGTSLGSGFTRARPGDVVILWATGLGPTNPAVPEGMLPSVGATVTNPVSVQLGGRTLPASAVLGAAVSQFAGTYQVAIRIPDSTDEGDLPVTLSVGGFTSPDEVFLPVGK